MKSLLLSIVLVLISISSARAQTTIVVPAGGSVQAAVNAAKCGDTIALQEGASYLGEVNLPAKGCSGTYITITTTNPASIPPQLSQYPSSFRWNAANNTVTFAKMTPALAVNMPKLKASSVFGRPVLNFDRGASYWKIVGIEITNDDTVVRGMQYNYLVHGGESGILSELPHHIEFDRVYIHPVEEDGTLNNITQRSVESGIIYNGSYFTFKNSACYGFTGWNKYPAPGFHYRLDAKCILLGAGPEDASNVIENNLLGSNGNIIFMGGSGGHPNPAHTATLSSITMNPDGSGSATFSNTTNLNVGDVFAVNNAVYGQRYVNNIPAASSAPWVVGGVTAKSGNVITWDFLGGGFKYRQNLIIPQQGITGGTFTLTHNGQTTAPIAYNPADWVNSTGLIRSALEALDNINAGDVSVHWNGDYGMMINMQGQYAYPNRAHLVTVNDAGLTGTPSNPSLPKMYRNNGPSESFSPVELPDVPSNGAEARWKGYVPTGHIIRRNIFDMPDEWRTASPCPGCPGGIVGEVKGFMEVKQGNRILLEANIFANRNTGLIITPINQGVGACCPWTRVDDFTSRFNVWTEGGANVFPFIMEQGQRTVVSKNYDISNNVSFWPIGHKVYEPDGTIFRTNQIQNVNMDHNTLFVQAHIGLNYGGNFALPPVPGVTNNKSIPLAFKNSLIFGGAYYPWGCTDGVFQIDCWPVATSTVERNLIVNLFEPHVPRSQFDTFFTNWPTGWYENTIPAGLFLNAPPTATQNYGGLVGRKWTMFDPRLNPASQYAAGGARQASDGKNIGADVEAINQAMGFNLFPGAISGTVPAPTPTPSVSPTPQPTPVASPSPVPTPTPPVVSMSFFLVAAQGGTQLQPVTNGTEINLALLPTRSLSMRIDPSAPVGSLRVQFDGGSRTENNAPYSLNADDGTNYIPANLSVGSHTLTITPFSAANLGGTAGSPITITFSVVDRTVPAPTPQPSPSATPTPVPLPSPSPSPSVPVPTPTPVPQPTPVVTREVLDEPWPSNKAQQDATWKRLHEAGWNCIPNVSSSSGNRIRCWRPKQP